MTWPHLGARVFGFAEEADRDVAGASITMVVMVGKRVRRGARRHGDEPWPA